VIVIHGADTLRDHLSALLGLGVDAVAVVVSGNLWLAYGTDPDGEWFFESGDPVERMREKEEDWTIYERVGFDFLGPQIDASPVGVAVVWPLIETEWGRR